MLKDAINRLKLKKVANRLGVTKAANRLGVTKAAKMGLSILDLIYCTMGGIIMLVILILCPVLFVIMVGVLFIYIYKMTRVKTKKQ